MKRTIALFVITLAIVVGCQSSQESGAQPSSQAPTSGQASEAGTTSPRELSMVSGNFFYSPKDITLTSGQPVKITFQNTGTHTFTIDALGVNIPLTGSSGVAEFTPTQSGAFEYYCAVPGHREAGMVGSLTVK